MTGEENRARAYAEARECIDRYGPDGDIERLEFAGLPVDETWPVELLVGLVGALALALEEASELRSTDDEVVLDAVSDPLTFVAVEP